MRALKKIDFNAPVILGMTFLSLAVLLLNLATRGAVNRNLAVFYTSWADPMMYVRLLTHVVCHSSLAHYTGNFLLILAVGPLVEEKYGSKKVALMVVVTALVTGLVCVLFFRDIMMVGASGVAFMLILLASFANIREGKLPLTVLLVAVLFIGNEIVTGFAAQDNIARFSHIAGGFCGAGFGLFFHGETMIRK